MSSRETLAAAMAALAIALAIAAPSAGAAGKKHEARPAKEQFGFVLGPAGAKAAPIGGYARGCLSGGVALPINGAGYQVMRLSRNRNWGHPALIDFLTRFSAELKSEENWPGLLIGDMSQPRGGPMLTGHKSHQIGLDADIWFKPMPSEVPLSLEDRENIEPLLLAEEKGTEVVAGNWSEDFARILKRAALHPEVERIFVHPAIKKALCASAGEDRAWLSKVRPLFGHNYHFHVRLSCPAGMAGCVPQKEPADDDGCGKELESWLKTVSRPAKAEPAETKKDSTKQVRRRELMVSSLPATCAAILKDGSEPTLTGDAAPETAEIPLPEPRRAVTQLASP
ncbi:MAG: penicillin-insensitive murein endopeptidase [Hyphomicrobiaceae bacterium]